MQMEDEHQLVLCPSCGEVTSVVAHSDANRTWREPDACSTCHREWDWEERWECLDDWFSLGLDEPAAVEAASRSLRSPSGQDDEWLALSGGKRRVRIGTQEDLERHFGSGGVMFGFPVRPPEHEDPTSSIEDEEDDVEPPSPVSETPGEEKTHAVERLGWPTEEQAQAAERLEELFRNAPGSPLWVDEDGDFNVDPLEEIRTWTLACGCEVVGSFLGIRGDNVETPNTALCHKHGRQAIVSWREGEQPESGCRPSTLNGTARLRDRNCACAR
jgi:hypothetical protein